MNTYLRPHRFYTIYIFQVLTFLSSRQWRFRQKFPQKEHDRPASHHEDANGRQRERSRAPGLVILTIISDATTPLLISLSREMTELELDTLPKRKAARGAVVYIVMVIFHHYILSICLSPLLMVCPKLAKKDEAAKDSRSHFVHTFQAPFTSRSHFAHKTHLPLCQSVD